MREQSIFFSKERSLYKKIMEDCSGTLFLGVPEWLKANKSWKDTGGATLVMVFQLPKENMNNHDTQREKLAS